tara:strand:+ start:909 stop:1544 length:636 start_codon:yes stop_codon:yes gene_type:complete
MNESSKEIKRLQLAHKLFSELLEEGDYPSDVQIELENNLLDCEQKIEALIPHNHSNSERQTYSDGSAIDYYKIDKSYFETDYDIDFYNGISGQKGRLLINKRNTVNLSGIQNDIFLALFNGLKKTWNTSSPQDIGWVSYDDFRNSVSKWRSRIEDDSDFEVPDSRITGEIDRINKKFKKTIGIKLIENGQVFLMAKHYRLKVNIGHIDLND